MLKTRALAFVFTVLMTPLWLSAAQQIHRCNINGSVTYQADPCPPAPGTRAPTVAQLNAERRKRLQQAADNPAAASAPAADAPRLPAPAAPPARARPTPPSAFRCDGRQFCSQMTSCAEANYFLKNCPDVHMDGNSDGIPCERQWCRPWQ